LIRRWEKAHAAYLLACRWLAGPGLVGAEGGNATWVNSRFTAAAWARVHGTPAEVLYPPVPPTGAGRPWAERTDRVVCLGRILFGKGIEGVVAIVATLRERGVPLTLVVAGSWDCFAAERRRLEGFLRQHDWIEVRACLSRPALLELLGGSRYGLHGMENEPFGIAVAEMQESGMIVLAPAAGGPAEIIGDERLLYRDESDAVEKLLRVRSDPVLQETLRAAARARVGQFSPERFMSAVRAGVASRLAQSPERPLVARND